MGAGPWAEPARGSWCRALLVPRAPLTGSGWPRARAASPAVAWAAGPQPSAKGRKEELSRKIPSTAWPGGVMNSQQHSGRIRKSTQEREGALTAPRLTRLGTERLSPSGRTCPQGSSGPSRPRPAPHMASATPAGAAAAPASPPGTRRLTGK